MKREITFLNELKLILYSTALRKDLINKPEEMSLSDSSCNNAESRPCTSHGQHNKANLTGRGVGKSAPIL